MLNEETYTLKVNRLDLCRISTVLLSMQFEFEKEDGHEGTARMYERLHEEVKKQIDEQDKTRGF